MLTSSIWQLGTELIYEYDPVKCERIKILHIGKKRGIIYD